MFNISVAKLSIVYANGQTHSIDIPHTLAAVLTGANFELCWGDKKQLEADLDPAFKAIKECEDAAKPLKEKLAIGTIFDFRGEKLRVDKHNTNTPWKELFEIALSIMPKEQQEAMEEERVNRTATTKKLVHMGPA